MDYLQKAHRRAGKEDHGQRGGHSAQVVHQATATDDAGRHPPRHRSGRIIRKAVPGAQRRPPDKRRSCCESWTQAGVSSSRKSVRARPPGRAVRSNFGSSVMPGSSLRSRSATPGVPERNRRCIYPTTQVLVLPGNGCIAVDRSPAPDVRRAAWRGSAHSVRRCSTSSVPTHSDAPRSTRPDAVFPYAMPCGRRSGWRTTPPCALRAFRPTSSMFVNAAALVQPDGVVGRIGGE